MSEATKNGLLDVAKMYEFAQRMYSEIPYRFLKSGYSFPAWHYYLEVTRRCNLRCKMCQYIDWLENTPIREQMEGELSTQEWLNVIDQIPRFSLITFTGGETFVRKDFMEILTHASKKARTHFISNTTMLPEERAEAGETEAPPPEAKWVQFLAIARRVGVASARFGVMLVPPVAILVAALCVGRAYQRQFFAALAMMGPGRA